MSIQSGFQYNFVPNTPLVDPKTGVPVRDGRDFLLALFNRTGAGTGIIPKVNEGLTATGSTSADALGLIADWNLIEAVAAGTGVAIPALKPGNDIEVWNLGANTLRVYPPSVSIEIDTLGAGNPFLILSGAVQLFQCWTLTRFRSLL